MSIGADVYAASGGGVVGGVGVGECLGCGCKETKQKLVLADSSIWRQPQVWSSPVLCAFTVCSQRTPRGVACKEAMLLLHFCSLQSAYFNPYFAGKGHIIF